MGGRKISTEPGESFCSKDISTEFQLQIAMRVHFQKYISHMALQESEEKLGFSKIQIVLHPYKKYWGIQQEIPSPHRRQPSILCLVT